MQDDLIKKAVLTALTEAGLEVLDLGIYEPRGHFGVALAVLSKGGRLANYYFQTATGEVIAMRTGTPTALSFERDQGWTAES